MTDNKEVSNEIKKNEVKNEIVQEKEVYLHRDFCKSSLPGVVETSSLQEIKKPKKSDESHNDES